MDDKKSLTRLTVLAAAMHQISQRIRHRQPPLTQNELKEFNCFDLLDGFEKFEYHRENDRLFAMDIQRATLKETLQILFRLTVGRRATIVRFTDWHGLKVCLLEPTRSVHS
jgi:hypothetical protein